MSKFTLFLIAFASMIFAFSFPMLTLFTFSAAIGYIVRRTLRTLFADAKKQHVAINARRVAR